MKIHLRLDDYPGMNGRNPNNIRSKIELMETFEMPYMLGVIPQHMDEEDKKQLKTLKYGRVCMHGFNHGTDHWRPADIDGGEFTKMTENDIEIKLLDNHDFIEEHKPNVFMPPFNSFTQELLNVLPKYGFEYVTGGPESLRHEFYKLDFNGMEYKEAIDFYNSSGKITGMLDDVKEGDTLAFHPSWDEESSITGLMQAIKEREMECVVYGTS